VKTALKSATRAAAGMLPAAVLIRLGMPALAAVVFLTVLILGMTCWIISSDERTSRVNRMMLARRGNARCLEMGASAPSLPTSRKRRQALRSRGHTIKGSTR
jgi:hypothetical protein